MQWLGVPVTAATPAETGHGIGWVKMGPAEPLLPFAVRHAVKLSSADLESLCCDFKVPVVMLPGERGVTMRANAVVLVNYLSPHESVATRIDIVESILGERRLRVGKAATTLDALEDLYEDEQVRFRDLKAELRKPPNKVGAVSRASATQEAQGPGTSLELKELCPGKGLLPGISLVFQRKAQSFQGYYTGASPHPSTSAKWGGPRTSTDPIDALSFVVRWLWTHHIHAKLATEADIPSRETMKAAYDQTEERILKEIAKAKADRGEY